MKERIYLAIYQGGTLWLSGVKKRRPPTGAVVAMGGRERCFIRQKEDASWEFVAEDEHRAAMDTEATEYRGVKVTSESVWAGYVARFTYQGREHYTPHQAHRFQAISKAQQMIDDLKRDEV